MNTRTLQLNSSDADSKTILRAAGVRRIHPGWYTVHYRGPVLDCSTVCQAKRNKGGEIG
jgi:hypothetical protein